MTTPTCQSLTIILKIEDFFLSHTTTLKILVYDVYVESLLTKMPKSKIKFNTVRVNS
jgi:hypothetical protein